MNEYVADTHALYWHLVDDKRLGRGARKVFNEAAKGKARIWISSIVLAECYWLLEKQDKADLFSELFEKLEQASQFQFIDFTAFDVLEFGQLSDISEMHDRIIAGVAQKMAVACITKDKELTEIRELKTIW